MALLWMNTTRRHALERTVERFKISAREAREIAGIVLRAVTDSTPEDWRFTTSPHGIFTICYEPEGLNCRFLGRSFRDRDGQGEALVKRLQAGTVAPDELKECAGAYQRLILSPSCSIYHEIKTCYRGPMDVSEDKALFARIKELLGHLVLMDEKRVAQRPNAVVVDGQLWARQGEFFDLSSGNADYSEYLLFEPLRPDGIDKSVQRIYSITRQGHIKLEREQSGGVYRPVHDRHSPRLRTQSYWLLPTYVDARYIDLCHGRRKWRGDAEERLDAGDMLLLTRIEKLQELLGRRRTGGS